MLDSEPEREHTRVEADLSAGASFSDAPAGSAAEAASGKGAAAVEGKAGT